MCIAREMRGKRVGRNDGRGSPHTVFTSDSSTATIVVTTLASCWSGRPGTALVKRWFMSHDVLPTRQHHGSIPISSGLVLPGW